VSEIRHETINGKKAMVAYLSEVGGILVEPEEATYAIARYKDGSHSYFVIDDGKKIETDETDDE